jgi:hypothetical protein
MSSQMPSQARAVGALIVLMMSVCGCNGEQARVAEKRKEALQPVDVAKKLEERIEATRVRDAKGVLLASDEDIWGLALPRGLKPRSSFEGSSYYVATATLEELEAYFRPRLETGQIERANDKQIQFIKARPVGQDQPIFLDVRVTRIPGGLSEVMVRVPRTTKLQPVMTEEEFQRKLAEEARTAR